MPEILDREASQAIACQNEKAVSPAQDIEEPALLVAHGSLGQRHAQLDCRLLFTRLECNHDQTATGQQLVKLLSQHQRRALDGLSELVPPDELAGARIEPKQFVVTGVDDQDRRIARNGLGRKRSCQTDGKLPVWSTRRGVEGIRETVGQRIRDRFRSRGAGRPLRGRTQDKAGR